MGQRYRIKSRKKYYVERDKLGRFKKWTNIKKSLAIDKSKTAQNIVKSGFGHKGDLKKRKRKIN